MDHRPCRIGQVVGTHPLIQPINQFTELRFRFVRQQGERIESRPSFQQRCQLQLPDPDDGVPESQILLAIRIRTAQHTGEVRAVGIASEQQCGGIDRPTKAVMQVAVVQE